MPAGPYGGFGSSPFGTLPFGTSLSLTAPPSMVLLSVLAIRENVVRLVFDVPPKWTGTFGPNDASDPLHYTVSAVAGSSGRDGDPTRPVTVVLVEQVGDGSTLDLILDRPMSPEPGQYQLDISGLVPEGGGAEFSTSVQYLALFKRVIPLTVELMLNNRDLSNPQSRSGIYDPLPVASGQQLEPLLGTYPIDSTGDIARDEGLPGYKKRVIRRLTTRKDRFAHLPGYGVGILDDVKQLARPGLRERKADEAEDQIKQEPETVSVRVAVVVDQQRPDIAYYRINAKATFGRVPTFDVPISFAGSLNDGAL